MNPNVTPRSCRWVAESLSWWRISVTVAVTPATPAVINGFDSYLHEARGHSGSPWLESEGHDLVVIVINILTRVKWTVYFRVVSHWEKQQVSKHKKLSYCWYRIERFCVFECWQPKHTISKWVRHILNQLFRFTGVLCCTKIKPRKTCLHYRVATIKCLHPGSVVDRLTIKFQQTWLEQVILVQPHCFLPIWSSYHSMSAGFKTHLMHVFNIFIQTTFLDILDFLLE